MSPAPLRPGRKMLREAAAGLAVEVLYVLALIGAALLLVVLERAVL